VSTWPDGTVAATYEFRHALYRDVLYERVPAGQRGELHRRVAERQESAYGERETEIAAELAHHFYRANNQSKAVKYFQLAGRQAVRRSADREAISHFTASLRIVETWPLGLERLRRELRLCVDLQAPLITTTGYTSLEVESVARKARELCRELGDGPELFAVLGRLGSVHFNRRELKIAIELGQQMMHIAQTSNSPFLLLWAHYFLGFGLAALGENQAAREHLEGSFALYDRDRAGSYGFVQDPGPTCLLQLAIALHRLGYPDLALRKALDGIQLARELSHPFTLAWVVNFATLIRVKRGDDREASALADENVATSEKYGFDQFLVSATVWQGFMMVRRGMVDGIARMREGLAIAKPVHPSDGLGLLAEAHLRLGQGKEGLAFVTEALTLESYGDCTAWLNRLKGDLLLLQDDREEAEGFFRESIEIARKQSDKSQELETTTALSRSIARKDRDEARVMLSKIYNSFTEGFDTPALKEAKALLDEWNATPAPSRRHRV
jgi:tetratricopeptide (TPR) repeat protein